MDARALPNSCLLPLSRWKDRAVILEAFSRVLKSPESQGRMPEAVLYDWLSTILLEPAAPQDHVAQIIHTEISLLDEDTIEEIVEDPQAMELLTQLNGPFSHGLFAFVPKSGSGERLLNALISFCRSYDQWQFSRWLHHVNASDFCPMSEHE